MTRTALIKAIYSLTSLSAHRSSAFLPHLAARHVSPVIVTTSLFIRSTRVFSASSSSILKDSHDPHPQTTHPLPPIASLASPGTLQKLRLRLGLGKELRERVVHKYFHGVDTKNIQQIVECFHPDGAVIRDISSVANRDVPYEDVGRMVSPQFLGERCREFLEAHPDAKVMFRLGPTCGRGRNNNWVYAHWYEEGSWCGNSQGIEPDGSLLTVQGQTRFLVDDDLKIKEIVITRTFSRWEEMMLLKREGK
eukprot:CAMPEP_0181126580 /NCGR_PEP_ID=MMETSP1071-20121207/27717_1 /TAXON_ID=35127 /ORGANISM="Thalassiosira sp., Strain NH16" /LENGTH=249 /DNA_ID=CAMNT_0023212215 /DNA_START=15 /DNA_END=764 /DNA_ORIENTATION=-